MNDLTDKIDLEAAQQWIEMEQVKRTFEHYDPLKRFDPTMNYFTKEQEVTAYIKNGKIVVNFKYSNLNIDSINIAAQIRRLPDVKSTIVHNNGNITVTLSGVRNAALLPAQIAAIARSYTRPIPETVSSGQLSMF